MSRVIVHAEHMHLKSSLKVGVFPTGSVEVARFLAAAELGAGERDFNVEHETSFQAANDSRSEVLNMSYP